MIKIYNTLSGKLEEFVPINKNTVNMYVCGPTVYDFIHIGNARPMIFFDTVRRYLIYKGYTVKYVSNFTDIDDKIINRANETGVTSKEVSEKFIEECKKDMSGMNIMPADVHPLATNEVDGMIKLIEQLIEQKNAYVKNNTVYFKVNSFKEYGKLSHKNLEDLRTGERELKVSGLDEKEDPLDFVLWKPMKDGEPFWESPFGKGRPGWHTECCVMSEKYLGKHIDIHAGGEDLIFPHHENEIAQSESANGGTFAKYWMHNAFLNINNHKMSKSLGNFFTVREISEKYDLQILRFFMLSAHYRSPLNFSEELIQSAKASFERIFNTITNLRYLAKQDINDKNISEELRNDIEKYNIQFMESMDDDFNTADAISAVFEMVKYTNILTKENKLNSKEAEFTLNSIIKLTDILGLIFKEDEQSSDDIIKIEELINERYEAKKNKDFVKADKIRDILKEMGIEIKDTRAGTQWKKI